MLKCGDRKCERMSKGLKVVSKARKSGSEGTFYLLKLPGKVRSPWLGA
jgi:hypothetical protein